MSQCSSKPKTASSPNVIMSNTETAVPKNTLETLPIEVRAMQQINAATYGCLGDGVQLEDISINGNMLTSSSANFNVEDIGKTVSVASAGIGGEHLITKIKKYISSNKVILKDSGVSNVSNVMGSYGTDNINFIQNAVNAAIKHQKILFFNPGVYLVGDRNTVANSSTVMIQINKPNHNFVMTGSGKAQTVFRELDGKTQRLGRYTKIFYHYLKDAPNIGTIALSNFSLDKNGRSLTKNPSSLYEWEQAHAWSWAGHKNGADQINTIHISNIEIFDKIGGGINFSSCNTKVGSVFVQNITETRPINKNNIKYGYRGDLEIACFSEDILFKNLKLNYIQLEPVRSFLSTQNRKRICTIEDSSIDTIEYTEGSVTSFGISVLNIKNCITKNFNNRGVEFTIENSTIKAPRLINSLSGTFINCKILIDYNDADNSIKPINATYLRTINNDNKIEFDNCQFVIDNDRLDIRPKGVALTSSAKVKDLNKNSITVKNCTFDTRLESSIDAYANGKWIIKNSTLSGSTHVIITGGYKEYFSELLLENNDYSTVANNTPILNLNNHNSLWKISGIESQYNVSSRIKIKGKKGELKTQNRLKKN